MKTKSLLQLAVLSLLFIGISCGPDDETCQESPEVCACLNNPLRCVSPVGTTEVTTEMQADSLNAVSKLPAGKK